MSEKTPLLDFPLILEAQAQKHLTHNEAINQLDVLLQLSVLDDRLATPPDAPSTGDRYIVADSASAAWAGQEESVAFYNGIGWQFFEPKQGWAAYVVSSGGVKIYDGGWEAIKSEVPESFSRLGINSTPDDTNRFAVASDAILLNHVGGGHQLKINKASSGNTASLLYQTNWSGRAEIGLNGSDAFSIKTSVDGGSWHTAFEIDPASGRPSFPQGGVRAEAQSAITFFVAPNGGNDVSSGLDASSALATIEEAVQRIKRLDHREEVAEVRLLDGTHILGSPIEMNASIPGLTKLTIIGDSDDADLVTINASSAVLSAMNNRIALEAVTLETGQTNAAVLHSGPGACIELASVNFTGTAKHCIEAVGGQVEGANLRIDCSASAMVHASRGGSAKLSGSAIAFGASAVFSDAVFVAESHGSILLNHASFSGSASGTSYRLEALGLLDGSGVSALPGTGSGSIAAGGVLA